MPTWRDDKIGELAKQLVYSPAEKRADQLANARDLFATIEPTKSYPWEFVLFRITGYRPHDPVAHDVSGKNLRADLAALVEFLSDTLELKAANAGQAVLDLDGITKRFDVSSKTIQRWRRRGLLAQRYFFDDAKKRLGFLLSDVEQFALCNKERVEKSASFRQLSAAEKAKIIRMARRLAARCQCCLKDISQRIGKHLQRSPETVRYTIRNYDKANPATAIFPSMADPIRDADREYIMNLFDRGISVDCLAKRWCRTRGSIYRVVSQERAERFKQIKIEYIDNPLFSHPDAENIILGVLPKEALAKAQETVAQGTNEKARDLLVARMPNDLPAYLREVFTQPVMPQEIEIDLFRRMNFLKYQAAVLREELDVTAARSTDLADIEGKLNQARTIKNQLVQANLRISVHVARKHVRTNQNLMELVSDANIWLMRAVERFDFARGFRFSTYASYSIMKNFARDRVEQIARPDRKLLTGQEEALADIDSRETDSVVDQVDSAAARKELREVIEQLAPRERELLTAHYGLADNHVPLSLAALGEKMGLTKTRVRQLETRALRKLCKLIEDRRGACVVQGNV